MSPEDKPVTRYEMGIMQESINQKIENSYLKGQLETRDKLDGIQKQLTEQVAFNAAIGAQTTAVATQTAELKQAFNNLTKIFVPNENIAPGWGRANVQPAPPLPPYPYPYPFPFPWPPAPETAAQTNTTTNG